MVSATADRLWAHLGFRRAKADSPWLAEGCGGSSMTFPLGWKDRLRVLISGKIQVDILHHMDAPPKLWESVSDIAVLPPNYPLTDHGE